MPLYLMLRRELVQPAPEILVFYRLLVSGLPALAFPGMDPLGDALLHVLRIGVDPDLARPLQRLKRADHRHQLHAVVGRRRFAATALFLLVFITKNKTPSPGPGIPAARAIGEDLHDFTAHDSCGYAA